MKLESLLSWTPARLCKRLHYGTHNFLTIQFYCGTIFLITGIFLIIHVQKILNVTATTGPKS